MKPVKILFIPHPMPSHLIPLIALAKQLLKFAIFVTLIK
jgi:UDP:flavonoid glycosyltransferase YjiC (YdhE family)